MLDWILIAGLAWVVIGFDWQAQKQENDAYNKWVDDWSIESNYGTLTNGNQVVVLRRDKESSLGVASDNTVRTTTYFSAALLLPNGNKKGLLRFGGATNLAIWPNSNPEKVFADDAAEAYWDATGGSGDEGPAGPVGPQEPQPENPRPELPDGGPLNPNPPSNPPSTPSLPSNPYGQDFNLGGGLL